MNRFKLHLQKFIELTDAEFALVSPLFELKTFRKKETIVEQGHVCRYNYFVLEGCLRKFFINEKGVEQTTEFAIENWWITDLFAFQRQEVTEFSIQAVESSAALLIDKEAQERLLRESPKFERYFRHIYQRAYAAFQMRIKYLYNYSREELYLNFLEKYPAFIQRIPQYLLASYLGFTPEYLSELRRKKRS